MSPVTGLVILAYTLAGSTFNSPNRIQELLHDFVSYLCSQIRWDCDNLALLVFSETFQRLFCV